MFIRVFVVFWSSFLIHTDAATSGPNASVSGCPLPNFPQNGHYALVGGNPSRPPNPGDWVPHFSILEYSCRSKNYILSNEVSVCQKNNAWSSNPTCMKQCTVLTSFTVDFKCISSTNDEIPCTFKMDSGTKIEPTCKPEHSPQGYLEILTCNGGLWDHPTPKCVPDCGLEKSFGITHIINAQITRKDSLPWHVGIYQNMNRKVEQICGGSILQTNIVISAAHCFFDEWKKRTIHPRYYKVAGGKYYRTWNTALERNVQISNVSLIKTHEFYGGDEQNQQTDVALIVLETPFIFSDSVHPICYDLVRADFNKHQLSNNNLGQVAGWGLTEAGNASEELKILKLPVIDYDECKAELSQYQFIRYLTQDKLCAGYLNGSAVCRGDSGGGLVFPARDVVGLERWYLRGVVSNGPLNDDRTSCRSNTYSAFTNIFTLRSWITRQLQILESRLDGCTLPDFPDNGEYIISNSTKLAVPGALVPHFTQLGYFCETNYHLSDDTRVLCQDTNVWTPLPTCIADELTCPPIPINAVSVQKTGQKSWDKCIELAESVYPCINGSRPYACAKPTSTYNIGRMETVPGEFPHMALIGYRKRDELEWNCAGSLISERWVLTSAHCLAPREGGLEYVRLGGNELSATSNPDNLYKAASLLRHPQFRSNAKYSDIGLVQLDREVTFTNLIRPACLHIGNQIDDSTLTSVAWSTNYVDNGEESHTLIKVILDKVPYSACSSFYSPSRKLIDGIRNDSQLCYHYSTEMTDNCPNDAQGPLQASNDHSVNCTFLIVGVSSFGSSCGSDAPLVYTRVSPFVPWIENAVWPQIPDGIVVETSAGQTQPNTYRSIPHFSFLREEEELPIWD